MVTYVVSADLLLPTTNSRPRPPWWELAHCLLGKGKYLAVSPPPARTPVCQCQAGAKSAVPVGNPIGTPAGLLLIQSVSPNELLRGQGRRPCGSQRLRRRCRCVIPPPHSKLPFHAQKVGRLMALSQRSLADLRAFVSANCCEKTPQTTTKTPTMAIQRKFVQQKPKRKGQILW
jgi:hypothetical protein